MNQPNLMDVPSQATRRIERYGLLALILFLTTFGVLYMWDGDAPQDAAENQQLSTLPGAPRRGYKPSSRASARPSEAASTVFAVASGATPPLAGIDVDQRRLAEQKLRAQESGAQPGTAKSWANGRPHVQVKSTFPGGERNAMSSFDSPAAGVSSSGYEAGGVGPFVAIAPRGGVGQRANSRIATAQPKLEYIVVSGDTLSQIAQDELGSVKYTDRLKATNGLRSDMLRVGQVLVLPHIGQVAPMQGADLKVRAAVAAPAVGGPEPIAGGSWETVLVREGDSLWKIAARELGAGHRYQEIMEWNQLNSEALRTGTRLRIAVAADEALALAGGAR